MPREECGDFFYDMIYKISKKFVFDVVCQKACIPLQSNK